MFHHKTYCSNLERKTPFISADIQLDFYIIASIHGIGTNKLSTTIEINILQYKHIETKKISLG